MKNKLLLSLLFLSSGIFLMSCGGDRARSSQDIEGDDFLIIGTTTSRSSEGIQIYRFDTSTGKSQFVGTAKADNPSFLRSDDDKKYVYSVWEDWPTVQMGSAWEFDRETGNLRFINRQDVEGLAPTYVAVDSKAKKMMTANYNGGNLSVLDINPDGSVSPLAQLINFEQPEGTGPGGRPIRNIMHSVNVSPDNKYVFAANTGTDNMIRLTINDSGNGDYLLEETLTEFKVPEGTAPRHFIFHPSGKYMYVIGERSGNVVAFNYNGGDLEMIQKIVADPNKARACADIVVTPDGKYLYASVRDKNDGVAIFSIDQNSGMLTGVGYQKTGLHPRNICVAPGGKLLLVANRNSNAVEVFKIDPATGLLTNTHNTIDVSIPTCLLFM